MLPGLSGEEVLPKIKGIPVIVVSAKTGVDDKVSLLLGGACDYVTKPFELKELLARIAVNLRKAPFHDNGETLVFDNITLNTISHSVTIDGDEVHLTRTEYAILKLLMIHKSGVVAKSVMLDKISVDTPDCTESSLKIHISNLRRKLRAAGGKDYIEAVWGIGFKLNSCNCS